MNLGSDAKKVVLRADGSSKIGLGHVMRLLAVGQMLEGTFKLSFACWSPDPGVKSIISGAGFPLIELSDQMDTSYTNGFDAVIIDGYWFDAAYVLKIKNDQKMVIQIDDMAGSIFFADMIINHAISTDYSNSKFSKPFQLLTGTDYAMLRKEFLHVKKVNRKFESPGTLTISLGGADPANNTLRLLKGLSSAHLPFARINVLVGNSYSYLGKLNSWIASHPSINVSIETGLNSMQIIALFQKSDLLLCSASTIVYEAAAVGLPIACYQTAKNQSNIYSGLVSSECVVGMGDLDDQNDAALEKGLSGLFSDYASSVSCVACQQKLIDGHSGKRIKEAILSLWN